MIFYRIIVIFANKYKKASLTLPFEFQDPIPNNETFHQEFLINIPLNNRRRV